ncbi:MAG: hypothetical protein AABX00_04710 [Nanoarchaeota archaeon]
MKIKIIHIILAIYLTAISIVTKNAKLAPWVFLIITFVIFYFLGKNKVFTSIENLLYILIALTPFLHLLLLFIIYLPFAVFGLLTHKKSFLKNYIFGFGISYIPSIFIYLISTYLSIPLNLISILAIFYILPIMGIFALKKIPIEAFEIDNKESIFILIILFFTIFIAIGIVDNERLFISNSVREFSRLQPAVEGLESDGLIPIYNPGTGQGDATYLWLPPGHISHFFTSNFLLKDFFPSILFFNAYSVFILLLSTLSLGLLFEPILNRDKSTLSWLAITSISLIVGLNFYFIQKLESIKEFSAFPLAYLTLSMILYNPKKFNDFFFLMFFSLILITIHSAYGTEIIVLSFWLFLFTKIYYVRDRSEPKLFFKWAISNKIRILATLAIISLLPLFYILNGVIYKDFIVASQEDSFSILGIKENFIGYTKNYYEDHLHFLSLSYPDVTRNDDHKSGFFPLVLGTMSLFFLIIMYKRSDTKNFRIFAFAALFQVLTFALFLNKYSYRFGGLFRTAKPLLIILLGASILVFMYSFKNKYLKAVFIAITFAAFLHTVPYAKDNLSNIHREFFMSGTVYQDEMNFISLLPKDGRIITYGVFGNAIDYGGNQLTGRYFSREDWEVFEYHNRNIYNTKIHSANSFGQADIVFNKSAVELHNYLRLGGYGYIFANVCHPAGNFIASRLYPDFSRVIYQNQQNKCMVIFTVNGVNYIEKVNILKDVNDDVYKSRDGYKYFTLNKHYDFGDDIPYSTKAAEPAGLNFTRDKPAEVKIYGNFNDNEWVSFKETYWPRWKAYMNNNEVPIYADNNEQILIRTVKGNSLLLKYSILPIEKNFGILSAIGFLGLSVFLLLLLKKQ